MEETLDWLREKIDDLKRLGFFEGETGEEVYARILSSSQDCYFGPVADLQEHPLIDAIILSFDKSNNWFVEDWMVYEEDQPYPDYTAVLENLSSISKGLFHPENIKLVECGYCDGRDKRIAVSYTWNEKAQELNFCIDGSALVLNFLEEVNDLMENYSFEYILDSGGTCFVMLLSNEQKNTLSGSLNFSSGNSYWLDKAQFYRNNGLVQAAENCFQKAIERYNEHFPFALYEYAFFLEEEGRIDIVKEVLAVGIKRFQDEKHVKKQWWIEQLKNALDNLS